MACTWVASDTSHNANAACAPAPVSSAVTCFPVSSLTSATTTAAPSLANRRAAAAPWPLPAPVMTATRPSSFPMYRALPRTRAEPGLAAAATSAGPGAGSGPHATATLAADPARGCGPGLRRLAAGPPVCPG